VCFIGFESKAPGLACQTGPEFEDAHRCWPFSYGGHIPKLDNELLHIAVPFENRRLEAAPVTMWRLLSPAVTRFSNVRPGLGGSLGAGPLSSSSATLFSYSPMWGYLTILYPTAATNVVVLWAELN